MLLVLQVGSSLSVGQLTSVVFFFCENDLLKGSCKTTETGSFPEHLHACQRILFVGLVLHVAGSAR